MSAVHSRLRERIWWLAPAAVVLLILHLTAAPLRGDGPLLRGAASASVRPDDRTGDQDTVRQASSGKLTRRARAAQTRSLNPLIETLQVDTSRSTLDYIRSLPRDSSARLAQFEHVRRDVPAVTGKYKKISPLFLPDPPVVRYRDVLDTTKWVYRLRRVLGDDDVLIPTEVPLEEYTTLRLQNSQRIYWEQLAQAYQLEGEKKTGLGELFGKVTNIEIPVPKNPLFSIFGPPIVKVQINGAVDIHAAFRNTKSDLYSASPFGQSRSEPDFNQEVLVNVRGEIGDKLKIDADWNTQRTFEYENQLHVKYTGYEDEIVQNVEAGNVSLPTNSAFISSSQALFGLKAGFQFGPLRLTTIATQKKGQIKELSVSGGARATPFEKRATDYSRDHFFIDTTYIAEYENIFLKIPAVPSPQLQIRDIEVWVSRVGQPDQIKDRDVVAFMDLRLVDSLMTTANRATLQNYDRLAGEVEVGSFTRLDPLTDYSYNDAAGILTMNKSIQQDQAIAVAYIVADPFGNPLQHGNFGARTTDTLKLVLKLVRPKNLDPQMRTAWRMMLKNRYPLGGRGVKKEGFEFRMEYEVYGQPSVQEVLSNLGLLELFGLDRYTGDNTPGADKVFDYIPAFTIDESRGEIIFPTVEPFRDTTLFTFFKAKGLTPVEATAAADSFSFNAIYDTTYNGALNDRKNKFAFRGNIKPSTASTYSLGFNIVQGSVEVIVDGQKATPNVDYTVDYMTGQVVIKNQAYLVPGKNLQIKYEANDLFQLASKSLIGARGDVTLGKNSNLGFTIMNLNQQSLSDKVRLGEEPISNTIMGVDGNTSFDLPFVTKGLNYLPGVQTLAMSSISLRGEAAYMSPDPNTRKSPIASDGGKSVAYIDDFEGARQTTPLGVSYPQWKQSSPPYYIQGLDPFTPGPDGVVPTDPSYIANGSILADTTKIEYKARATWFNVNPSDVFIHEIWPLRSVVSGQNQVPAMTILYQPQLRGAFNYSTDLDGKLFADPTKGWAGMQHLIGITSTNLLDQNVSFVEFWVKVIKSQPGTKLNVDLGYLSEDVLPNRILNTEDGVDGNVRSGIMRPGEDVGIDMLTDDQERVAYADFINKYRAAHPEYEQDPSGDNWSAPPYGITPSMTVSVAVDYVGTNGTEGNARGEAGLLPDTEDLNNNNVLDRSNAYFEYEIPLDTSDLAFQRYVSGKNERTGWYQIRIPLNEFTRQIGQPTLTNVEGVRLWLTGAQTDVLFRIAEFNLVGNQWEERVKNDSTFKVSVVNVEDDPYYNSPPGVPRLKDPSHPDQEIYGNEQSLNLIIKGLRDGETREAIKRYSYKPLDVFSYRMLKMFIHGQDKVDLAKGYNTFGYRDTSDFDAEVFLRFGSDSLNYYEYRAPVHPGWADQNYANDIVIRFADLTTVKLQRDSAGAISRRTPVPGGIPGATYQVVGEPTLTNIRFFSVGLHNPTNKGTTKLDGELWVDEMRLTDVDDTPGWAYRLDTQLRLADIASVAFSYSERDPNFHALEERFGSRTTQRNWTLATSASLEKLLPERWAGTTLTVSYTHAEGFSQPKYMPGTDILVESAARRLETDTSAAVHRLDKTADALRTRTQDLSVTDTYAAPGVHLNIPSTSWLVTETINRMTFGYSYSITRRRSPTVEYSEAWGWQAQFSYSLPLSLTNYWRPLTFLGDAFPLKIWKNLRIFYTPKQISLSASLARNQSREKARLQQQPNPVVRNLVASRSMSFSWQLSEGGLINPLIDYQASAASTLLHLETDKFGRQRSLGEILSDIFFTKSIVSFGIDQNYNQTISLSTRLVVFPLWSLDKIFTMNPSPRYSSSYSWFNNIQAGALGKSAGVSTTLNTGLDISLKPISEAIWGPATPAPVPSGAKDTSKGMNLKVLGDLTRYVFKIPIFDFERISFSFNQSNRMQNSGVVGDPGFANVFGRVPFFQSSLLENGPSLLYQLGLASDPNGRVVLKGKSGFPFFTGYTVPGLRAPNGNLNDVFAQNNAITMRTSRQLWTGADLELNWRLSWSTNENRVIITDASGVPKEQSRTVSGDVERSYFTMPPVLFFKLFRTSLDEVNNKYQGLKQENDGRSLESKLSQAFEEGLEGLPILRKIFGTLMPRANWTIRWGGLESLPLFKSFASRVSLDHSYNSSYRERWRMAQTGDRVTESQTVTYGFAPLIGVNIGFKDFIKGNLGATFRYSTTTSYDLSPSAQNVIESGQTDLSFSATYSRQGFELPFFGLSLSNDLDANVSYTYKKNVRRLYDFRQTFKSGGTPMEGSNTTSLEPRIRYVLSSRVTASLYYRYTKISPDAGGSRIPGSTINEGGLDIHVAIQ